MWGISSFDDQAPQVTPFEKCKTLLISIRLERRKSEPDVDMLAKWHSELYSHKTDTITAAFNEVVDQQGW